MLTANAFNLWALIFGIDFSRNDLTLFFGLNLRAWGQILFGLSLLPVLTTLLFKKADPKITLWSLAIVSLASFVFLTNMHERYLSPLFPYLTILIFLFPKLKVLYFFSSLIFCFNLYHLWYVPDISWLRAVYQPVTIKLFSIVNLILAFWLELSFFRFLRPKKL